MILLFRLRNARERHDDHCAMAPLARLCVIQGSGIDESKGPISRSVHRIVLPAGEKASCQEIDARDYSLETYTSGREHSPRTAYPPLQREHPGVARSRERFNYSAPL